MKEAADFVNNIATSFESFTHVFVRHQIKVTLAITDLRVLQPVPFAGRRTQGLGEDDELGDLYARLARLGGEHLARHTDEVAEVEVLEDVELLVAQGLLLRVKLDAVVGPTATFEVEELALAHVAVGRDAPGQFNLIAFLQFARDILGPCFTAAQRRGKLIGEGIDALLAEGGELGFALFNQRIQRRCGRKKVAVLCSTALTPRRENS